MHVHVVHVHAHVHVHVHAHVCHTCTCACVTYMHMHMHMHMCHVIAARGLPRYPTLTLTPSLTTKSKAVAVAERGALAAVWG